MKSNITHASLFSGIGGAEYAAEQMGWTNLFHCEIQTFPRSVLDYWYHEAESYDDITKTDFRKWRGRVTVLTGGFPCQPFSTSGRRRGALDDRYLWPEMLRAIREIHPSWVVGENVNGLTTMVQPAEGVEMGGGEDLFSTRHILRREQPFTLYHIIRSLEREGYSVQPFVIPACAVGAPHRRDRVWIVAHADGLGDTSRRAREEAEGERCGDNGEPQERSVTPEWADGLSRLQRTLADTLGSGSGQVRQDPQHPLADGAEPHGQGLERTTTHTDDDRLERRHEGDNALSCGEMGNKENQGPAAMQRPCDASPSPDTPHDRPVQRSVHAAQSRPGLQPAAPRPRQDEGSARCQESLPQDRWRDFPTQPPLCSRYDGLPFDVACLSVPYTRWRAESIRALGNAWVPQVAVEIFRAIELEERRNEHAISEP